MSKTIKDTIICVATLYMFGLLFVLAMVASGYQGGDMLTEHYRTALQAVVSMF